MSDYKRRHVSHYKRHVHPTNNILHLIARHLSLDFFLTEILPRLPVKTLLRFCCVAKSWNSLISSHHLSKTHFHNSKRHSNFQHRIMFQPHYCPELKHFSLDHHLYKPMAHVFDEKLLGVTSSNCNFVGSCNGLICIDLALKGLVVFNPSIQKVKVLPDLGVEYSDYEYLSYRTYGFGFDESSDDYKVVGFFFDQHYSFLELVKIYSLKTGETKRIKIHEGRWIVNHRPIRPPIFANGKLHWFVERGHSEGESRIEGCIAYLDLATEEYGILEIPRFGNSFIMAQSGGSLYVYNSSRGFRFMDVWLVEPKYGIGRTAWTELIRGDRNWEHGFDWEHPVSTQEFNYIGNINEDIRPLCVINNHRKFVFVSGRGDIIILNSTRHRQSIRKAQFSNLGPFVLYTAIAYVQSLVHP